jgi:hypothetical protein
MASTGDAVDIYSMNPKSQFDDIQNATPPSDNEWVIFRVWRECDPAGSYRCIL